MAEYHLNPRYACNLMQVDPVYAIIRAFKDRIVGTGEMTLPWKIFECVNYFFIACAKVDINPAYSRPGVGKVSQYAVE